MSSLGAFFDAMIKKRELEMEAGLANQKALQEGIGAIGSGISNAVSGIGGAMETINQGKMANSLISQQANMGNLPGIQPPRAAAVDPNAPGVAPANAAYGGPTAPYQATGGMNEYNLRKGMGQFQGQRTSDLMSAMKYQQQERFHADAMARQQRQERSASANAAFSQKSKAADDVYRDTLAYTKSIPELTTKMTEAKTQAEYDSLADQMRALNSMASSRKLDVTLATIPPYVSPADKAALAKLETAQAAQAGQPQFETNWRGQPTTTPTPLYQDVLSAQQGIAGRTSPMSAIPTTGIAPQPQAPAGGFSNTTGKPPGTEVGEDAQGRKYVVDPTGRFIIPR